MAAQVLILIFIHHIFILRETKIGIEGWFGWFVVFNANYNNILVISCGQLYRGGQFYWWWNRSTCRKPPTCRKTLSHNVVSSTPHHGRVSKLQI
jgi:hypothetical protein